MSISSKPRNIMQKMDQMSTEDQEIAIVADLIKQGKGIRAVARILGKSKTWVSRRFRMLGM